MIKRNFKFTYLFLLSLMYTLTTFAQTGMNFQGVARNSNGVILASQPITIRLSILQGTASGTIEYQETKSINTNAQGLFNLVIGDGTSSVSIGNYNNINWQQSPKFVKIEMDANAGNNFTTLGTTQLQYVAYAYFANGVAAENIVGLVPVARGGTGASTLLDLKNNLQIDKVNNTADSLKPISKAVVSALLTKLNNADTIYLSNRINTKLNTTDTIGLISLINSKFSTADTLSLSNRINLKMNLTDGLAALTLKANTSDVNTALGIKANTTDLVAGLAGKVDKVLGKDLSTNDYTNAEKTKLAAITGTNTGDQDLSSYATITTLSLKANTSDVNANLALKANSSDVNTALGLKANTTDLVNGLAGKVDKVLGKSLSTNDYSTAEKTKLAAITGTNTGDQDLTSYATNSALALKANTSDINTALAAKENTNNKSTANDLGGLTPSDILFPTQKAVKDYITANSASGGIVDGGITTIKLADGAVTSIKLSDLAVTDAKIATGISKSKIGLGNVENTALSTWAGSNNLTSVGTISTGIWSGTSVAITNGGTGATNAAAARSNLGLVIGTNVQAPLIAGTDYQTPLTAGSSYLVPNSNITAASKTKITYDVKGLVTGGADATTADIAPSTDRNYVTDAQKSGVLSNTSGINTGDETASSIKTKLGITTLSGSNTGDQTIVLTGDVTGSGSGSFSTSIGNSKITNSMLAGSIASSKLIGTDINTVGTITTGTWSGSVIGSNVGGSGNINGILKANGNGVVSAALANDLPDLSLKYLKTNDGSQPAQNSNIILTGGANFGYDITVSGNQLGIGLNDRDPLHNNLAFGSDALLYNVYGINNLAFGRNVLINNYDGSGNTAVGSNASITSNGNNNTSFGVFANSGIPDGLGSEWNRTTYGNNNTAVGAYALMHSNDYYDIDGNYINDLNHNSNTAIGAYAMSNIVNGYSNIVLGVNAGNTITDGFKNIIIGDSAGNNTTSQYSNAIAIGVKAPLKGNNTIQLGSDGSNGGTATNYVYTSGKLVSGGVTYPNTAGTNGQTLVINNGQLGFTDFPAFSTTNLIQNSATLSSPQSASISITGGITTAGDASINGITIGKGAGNQNTNIAFGNYALSSNTSGHDNISLGSQSLFSNTTGNSNVAIGSLALNSNSTGGGNIAMGNSALSSNTTGAANIAMGNMVLGSNSTGNGNIALGSTNLYKNSIGYNNISIGSQNLFNNLSGNSNIALGSASLNSNTIGNNNISLGTSSLAYNTSGNENIAIGINAMNNNTTGINNIAMGTYAMSWNRTGSNNVAINGNTSGNNNTVIGWGSNANNVVNSTAIGSNAYVTSDNTIRLGDDHITDVLTTGKLRTGSVVYPNTYTSTGAVLTLGNSGEAYWATLPTNVIDITTISNNVTSLTSSVTSITSNVTSLTSSMTSITSNVSSLTSSVTSITNNAASTNSSITSLTSNISSLTSSVTTLTSNVANLTSSLNAIPTNAVPYSGATMAVDLGNYDLKANGVSIGKGSASIYFSQAQNTILGYQALNNNTWGDQNVAIGSKASYLNSTGSGNISNGYNALYNNTTGDWNTAIGSETLFTNNGSRNIANGFRALYYNTTGSDNISIGHQSLFNNTTGSNNIGIGASSNNTTGSYNVYIGGIASGSGYTNVNKNTAIGFGSRIDGNYTNSTAIGYNAGAFASNCIFLGDMNITNVYSRGAFSSSSDRRIKKNIEPIAYGLSSVLKLNPVKFQFIQNNQTQIGFIAQEIRSVIPELVSGTEGDINKGEILSVSYPNMVSVLTKALQEEDEKNEKLKKEVNNQKIEIDYLKRKIELILKKLQIN
jgi:hypothetical protein